MDRTNKIIFCIFVYNIIFGSGLLFLPKAFWSVGYQIGLFLLLFLALISWTSCVFVVESLSLANFKYRMNNLTHNSLEKSLKSNDNAITIEANSDGNESRDDKMEYFAIDKKFEVAEMAKSFFKKYMLVVFYGLMILYLYGDLCIYLSVVGSTLTSLSCPGNSTRTSMMTNLCENIGTSNIFRIYVSVFFILTAPFAFMNLKKSIFIQIITIILRLIAVITMLTFALIRIKNGAENDLVGAKWQGVPYFFGITLYSFMCQHSLPSMINYVNDKKSKFNYLILISMGVAFCLYIITVITACLAFKGEDLQDIYSNNFRDIPNTIFNDFIYYFLMIFPTMVLSGSYPIISITLRENIVSLTEIIMEKNLNTYIRSFLYPVLTIFPSFIVVLLIPDKVGKIAGYVGSYAGSFVQYFIPACLVLYARKTIRSEFPEIDLSKNYHSVRIFNNKYVPMLVTAWTFVCIAVVTYCEITKT